MFKRRDPKLLSQYLCYFCETRIPWGEIWRIVRTDPDQPDYELYEMYGHRACVRANLLPDVPLKLARRWNGKLPMLDDSHEIVGRPCGICGEKIARKRELTRLRIQEPMGTVRAAEFDEESAPVHKRCIEAKAGWRRQV